MVAQTCFLFEPLFELILVFIHNAAIFFTLVASTISIKYTAIPNFTFGLNSRNTLKFFALT